MNIIILKKEEEIKKFHFLINDNRVKHIREILKLNSGSSVEVGLLNGPKGIAKILTINNSSVSLYFNYKVANKIVKSNIEMDLICALPRPQTIKKILKIAGTFSLRSIDFIRANRVEKSYYQSPLLEPEKQLPYLIEGLSQGKNTRLPIVRVHNKFKSYFETYFINSGNFNRQNTKYLLAEPSSNKNLLQIISPDINHIVLAIGPEGGWIPFEIEFMEKLNFIKFNLSPNILRVETALISAVSQIELCNMQNSDTNKTI